MEKYSCADTFGLARVKIILAVYEATKKRGNALSVCDTQTMSCSPRQNGAATTNKATRQQARIVWP